MNLTPACQSYGGTAGRPFIPLSSNFDVIARSAVSRSPERREGDEAISNGNCMGLLRGACPERHRFFATLRMTPSEGLAMTRQGEGGEKERGAKAPLRHPLIYFEIFYLSNHSSLVTPARLKIRERRATPISLRCGLGMVNTSSPFIMYGCFPP